jgi:hypothetical protein
MLYKIYCSNIRSYKDTMSLFEVCALTFIEFFGDVLPYVLGPCRYESSRTRWTLQPGAIILWFWSLNKWFKILLHEALMHDGIKSVFVKCKQFKDILEYFLDFLVDPEKKKFEFYSRWSLSRYYYTMWFFSL